MSSARETALRAAIRAARVFYGNTRIPMSIRRAATERLANIRPVPAGLHMEKTQAGGCDAFWFYHDDSDPGRVLFYLHGGGYHFCSPITHRNMLSELARLSGFRILALNYRKAPEFPYPSAVDDADRAYRWLLSSVSSEKIIFGGDSAGGGLAMATAINASVSGLDQPAGIFLLSPWLDLTGTSPTLISHDDADPMLSRRGILSWSGTYLQGADPTNPTASPLLADLTGLPPLLIEVGSREVLLDDARRLHLAAEKYGVSSSLTIYQDMIHVFQAFGGILPEADQSLAKIAGWMGQRLRAGG